VNSFEKKMCQINQIQHGRAAAGRASNITLFVSLVQRNQQPSSSVFLSQ
jgi:hypothetical protein